MAYIDDPRKKQQQALPGATLAGTAPVSSGSPATQGQPAPTQAPGQKGSGFVNLQTMLQLNRPQAEAAAAGLTGKVGAQAETARAQGQGVVDAFGARVKAGTPSHPTPDGYTGPTDVSTQEGYSAALGGLQRAEDRAVAGLSQGGREGLVASQHPGGSAGEGRLSAYLLGQAAPDAFGGLASRYGSLSGMMGAQANPMVEAARRQGDAMKAAWRPPVPAPAPKPAMTPERKAEIEDEKRRLRTRDRYSRLLPGVDGN